MTHKGTKFCPNCGSPNVGWVLPQTWSKWQCKDCGYVGVLIIEDEKMADEVRMDFLAQQSEDDVGE